MIGVTWGAESGAKAGHVAVSPRPRCPLCDGDRATTLSRAPAYLGYLQCDACGFVWRKTPVSPDDDIALESRNEYYLGQQARIEQELAAIEPWVDAVLARAEGPVHAVAELGCTNGFVLKTFARKGKTVLGVERCPATAAFGAEVLQLPVVITDIMAFTPRRRYDLVWMTHILEHMPDPVATLRHVRSAWCASPALIYLEVPALDMFLQDAAIPATGDVFCESHASLFTEQTLNDTVRRAGFDRFEIARHEVDEPGRVLTVLEACLFHPV